MATEYKSGGYTGFTLSTHTMQTTITGSLRKVASGKSYLMKLCFNFKKEHVESLQLTDNRHVEITKSGDKYKVRFRKSPTARSMTLSLSDKGGARVMVNPTMFKITADEPSDTTVIVADYLEDDTGLTFDFDVEEFLRPREERIPATISNAEEKVEAGFEPDSAWGEKFQQQTEERIRKVIQSCMKAKFGGFDED
jgi:hypothetical protein